MIGHMKQTNRLPDTVGDGPLYFWAGGGGGGEGG